MAKLAFLIILYTGSVLAYTSTEVPTRPKKMTEEDLKALFGKAKTVRSQPSHKDHAVQLLSRFLNSKSDDVSSVARNIKKDLEIDLAGISNQDLDAQNAVEWVDWEQAKREVPGHVNDVLVQALRPSFNKDVRKELASNEKREGLESSDLDWYRSIQSDFNDVMESQKRRTAGELKSSDDPSQRSADKFDTLAMFLPAEALMESKRSWGSPLNALHAKIEDKNSYKSSNVKSQRSADQIDTIAMFWPAETLMKNKRSWGNAPNAPQAEIESRNSFKSPNVKSQRSADQLDTIAMFWPAERLMENKRSWGTPPNSLQTKLANHNNLKSSNIKSQRSAEQLDTVAMFWPAETLLENKRSWPILPKGSQSESDIERNLKSFYPKSQRSADQLKTIAMFWPAETLEQNKRSWGKAPQERPAKSEGESSQYVINSALSDWSLRRSAKPDNKELHSSSLRSEPMAASLGDWFDVDSKVLPRGSGQEELNLPLKSRSSRLKDAASRPTQRAVWSPNFKRASKQALYDVLDQLAKISKQTNDKRDNTIVSKVRAIDNELVDPSSTFAQRSPASMRGGIEHIVALLHPSFAKD